MRTTVPSRHSWRAAFAAAAFFVLSAGGASAQVFLAEESFTGVTFPPTGWEARSIVAAAQVWNRSTVSFNTAPASARFFHALSNNHDWLITPAVDLSAAGPGTVLRYFENVLDPFQPVTHQVLVSTTYDGSNFNTTIGVGQQWQVLRNAIGAEGVWTEFNLNVDAFTGGTARFAFRYSGADGDDWYIDDVSVLVPAANFDVEVVAGLTNQYAAENTVVSHPFTVTNSGSNNDTFTLSASTSEGWATQILDSGMAPVVAPVAINSGVSANFTANVTVPPGATLSIVDTVTLTAAGVGGSNDSAGSATTVISGEPYLFDNSNNDFAQPTFPAFEWVDISGTGLDLLLFGLADDDITLTGIPLGYVFTFYGLQQTELAVTSNGLVGFLPGIASAFDNEAVPTAGSEADNYIAGWWDDMNPTLGSVSGKQVLFGTSPVRGGTGGDVVVSFINLPELSAANNDDAITFQVILHQDGSIRVQYQTIGANVDLAGATIGVESPGGVFGSQYRFNGTGGAVSNGLAIQFSTNANDLPVEISAIGLE